MGDTTILRITPNRFACSTCGHNASLHLLSDPDVPYAEAVFPCTAPVSFHESGPPSKFCDCPDFAL